MLVPNIESECGDGERKVFVWWCQFGSRSCGSRFPCLSLPYGEGKISVDSSSAWAERGFYKDCGSSLFYHLKETDHYIVCCGLFEDQSRFEMSAEIYVDEQQGGYAFAGNHPLLTGEAFLASMDQES